MAKDYKRRRYYILIPLIVLFAAGVLVRTIRLFVPNIASIPSDFTGSLNVERDVGFYHGREVAVPQKVFAMTEPVSEQEVLGLAKPSEKWIEVDLSDQTLRAWEGDSLFLETLVSTGLPWWPTPTGEFRIWVKLRATGMEGGSGRYYYNLPNVPYVMFFENKEVPSWRGYGLHGTYWHNDFGNQRSHGCVNLPTEVAEKLYYWVSPELPDGKTSVYASEQNTGTKIIIHD